LSLLSRLQRGALKQAVARLINRLLARGAIPGSAPSILFEKKEKQVGIIGALLWAATEHISFIARHYS